MTPSALHPPSQVLDTDTIGWIPLEPGQSFKPLAFLPDDHRQLLLRVEPGAVVPLHRHRGAVHAFTVSGRRELLLPEGPVEIGPGTYVFEPVGHTDSWRAVGTEPCVVHIAIDGAMEYLGQDGRVVSRTDSAALRRRYLEWCTAQDRTPVAAWAVER